MKIIIAGAYAIGTHLARLLSRSNEEITLIDESEERLASIGSDCDLLTMVGKPTSLKILRDAGTADADLFIAVTPLESTNITENHTWSPRTNNSTPKRPRPPRLAVTLAAISRAFSSATADIGCGCQDST